MKTSSAFVKAQEEYPIFSGRPFNRLGLPISLFCPAFARLLYNLQHLPARATDQETLESTILLFGIVQQRYGSEIDYQRAITPMISKILQLPEEELSRARSYTSSRSHHVAESDIAVFVPLAGGSQVQCANALHIEVKLALLEADIQSIYTHRKHVTHKDAVRPEGLTL